MRALTLAALVLAGCPAGSSRATCAAAARRLEVLPCVNEVPDRATWDTIARPADDPRFDVMTKWAAPFGDDSPLPEALFLNSNTYPLHWQMLGDAFPDQFPGVTLTSYSAMVLDPRRKVLSSGNLVHLADEDVFAFTVWDDYTRPALTLTVEEAVASWEALSERFEPAELLFLPNTDLQAENAASWDLPFSTL